MKRLLNLVLSASILALTACDKPIENPNKTTNADLAQLTPARKITKYSQPSYVPLKGSLHRAVNQDPPQFCQDEQIKPVWPYQ